MCIASFGAELITKLELSYKCTLYFRFDEWSFKTLYCIGIKCFLSAGYWIYTPRLLVLLYQPFLEVLMYDEKIEKTNLVKRVQEMLVCYFSKSIIGVWYTLRSHSKVVLIISWDTPLSSNWEVGKWKDITKLAKQGTRIPSLVETEHEMWKEGQKSTLCYNKGLNYFYHPYW